GIPSRAIALRKATRAVSSFPVGAAGIATRVGVRPQTVHAWRQRRLLPGPRWTVSGQPAWDWVEAESWTKRSGRLREPDVHGDMLGLGRAGRLRRRRCAGAAWRA